MDERKQEMLRWLDELGQYADENGLSSRIMDGIEACKADLKSGNVEMDKIQLEAEQLLDSIRKKAVPEPVRDKDAEGRVTFEDVERQIKKWRKGVMMKMKAPYRICRSVIILP